MKRLLACLALVTVALLATAGLYVYGADTQELLYNNIYAQDSGYEISATFGHAVAYAENGTGAYTQSTTLQNCSPRSGFPTVSIGSRIPAPSFEGYNMEYRSVPVMGKPCKGGKRLYVLRV